MRNLAHLLFIIGHDVIAFAQPLGRLAHALFTKIDVAIGLAHDQQVDGARHLLLQGRRVRQLRKDLRGTQVGEQPQCLAQAKDRLLRP